MRAVQLARLKQTLSDLAGGAAAICYREPDSGPDERFVRELARIRETFGPDHPVSRFLAAPAKPHSAQRELQWTESRRCVIEVIDALRAQGAVTANIRISLSHTKQACIAIGVGTGLGVGVDIEPANREISGNAFERFTTPAERTLGLSALALWAVKEACFKADPCNQDRLVPQYQVCTAQEARNPAVSGIYFNFQVSEFDSHIVAVAVNRTE